MLKKTRDLLLTLALALALSALAGCFVHVDATGWEHRAAWSEAGPTRTGSGVEGAEVRDVEAFDAIDLVGPVDLVATIGDERRLEVIGDENLLDHCVTEVDEGTLTVRMDPGSYRFKRGMQLAVTTPTLESVRLTGSCDATITGLDGASLELLISGSGDISAAGTVDQLRATVSGSGDLKLDDLVVRAATVSISGSGDVHLQATESLDAAIVGSGDIRYRGNPAVSLQTCGSGSLRPAH